MLNYLDEIIVLGCKTIIAYSFKYGNGCSICNFLNKMYDGTGTGKGDNVVKSKADDLSRPSSDE